MADGAAHLVGNVLPEVPIRHELRVLLAFQPDLLSAVETIFMDAIPLCQGSCRLD